VPASEHGTTARNAPRLAKSSMRGSSPCTSRSTGTTLACGGQSRLRRPSTAAGCPGAEGCETCTVSPPDMLWGCSFRTMRLLADPNYEISPRPCQGLSFGRQLTKPHETVGSARTTIADAHLGLLRVLRQGGFSPTLSRARPQSDCAVSRRAGVLTARAHPAPTGGAELSQSDLAEMIGASRQTLNDLLKNLQAKIEVGFPQEWGGLAPGTLRRELRSRNPQRSQHHGASGEENEQRKQRHGPAPRE
jgi:hypothetical protein